MDPNSILDGTSSKVHFQEVPMASTSSSATSVTSADDIPKHFIRKHIIHRITPSDLKKLQEVGLDRKIAEALSKYKSQQKNKYPNRIDDTQQVTSHRDSSQKEIKLTVSSPEISSTASKSTNVQDAVICRGLNKSKVQPKGKFATRIVNEIVPIQHNDQYPLEITSTETMMQQEAASGSLNMCKSQEKVKFSNEIANELEQVHHKDSSQNFLASKPMCSSESQDKSKFLIQSADEVILIPDEDSCSTELNSTDTSPVIVQEAATAKRITMIRCRQPPKITITAPDTLSEIERQQLETLGPHQRLMHVKNLLNKKILEKKGAEANDKPKTNRNLMPPMPLLSPNRSKEQQTKHFVHDLATTEFVLSEIPQIKLTTKPKVSEAIKPNYQKSFTNLKEEIKGIPKACITSVKYQHQENFSVLNESAQDFATIESLLSDNPQIKLPSKQKLAESTKTTYQKCFTNSNERIEGIPKACITSVKNKHEEFFAVLKETAQDFPTTESVVSDNPQIKSPIKSKLTESCKTTYQKCFTNSKEGVEGIPKGCIAAARNQPKKLFAVLKEHALDLTLTESALSDIPQIKLPTTPTVTEACRQKCFTNLQEGIKGIPKASIISVKNQQQDTGVPSTAGQTNIELHQYRGVLPTTPFYIGVNIPKETKSLKQPQITQFNQIPKASIKTSQSKEEYSNPPCGSIQLKRNDPKIDAAEISAMNVQFPIINIPTATPLPAIDSFKKPLPTTHSTSYYNLQQTAGTSNSPNCSRSLVVLENKVLSQDEMIDLTELCLSTTSKDDIPRFINPHRPIPEVVIKQEKTDEYPTIDITSDEIKEKTSHSEITNELKRQSSVFASQKPISTKQNKKIIINAQKLKLPPEQLAALAKKVKEKTSASAKEVNLSTTSAKNAESVLLLNKNDFAKTSGEIAGKFILRNKEICSDAHKKDHNYQYQEIDAPPTYFINNKSSIKHIPVPTYSRDKLETTFLNNTITSDIPENCGSCSSSQKSAVEIVDEPSEIADCFSAIDFIVALSNTNPITEESSLTLSPEELNLNASCAMNLSPIRMQSYPILKNAPISKVTSTPIKKSNQDDILLNTHQVNTIVSESSKASECILNNETPSKSGELKKNKSFNKIIEELEVGKSSQTQSSFISSKIQDDLLVSNKALGENLEAVPAINFRVGDSNLIDMPFDLDLEISLEGQRRNDLKNNTSSLDNKSTNIYSKFQKSFEEAVENASNDKLTRYISPKKKLRNKDLKNVAKKPDTNEINVVILKPNENQKDFFLSTSEISKTYTDNSLLMEKTKSSNNFIKEPETNSHAENSAPNITEPFTKQVDRKAEQVQEQLQSCNVETKSSFKEISISSSNIAKLSGEIEAPKADEITSNGSATSKRIFRFKKGKINLVQRNKSGQQTTNKPLSEDNEVVLNKSLHDENKVNSEHKIVEKDVGPTLNSETVNKTLTITNEKNMFPTHTNSNMSSEQSEENVKETLLVKGKPNKKTTDKTPPAPNVIEHTIIDEGSVLAFLLQKNQDVNKNLNFSQSLPLFKAVPHNTTPDKTNASMKTGNASQQYSNETENILHENSSTEIGDITQASLKTTNSLQQCVNLRNTDSTKTYTKLNFKESSLEKLLATNVTAKSNEIQDNIEANQSESSKLQTSPKKETVVENLNQASKYVLETMKSAKISLMDIVRHSPVNIPEGNPVIPFKKITNEVSDKLPEVNVITTLLDEIKSGNKKNHKDVEKLTSSKESSVNIKTPKSGTVKTEEHTLLINKCSSQSLSRDTESRTEKPPSCVSTRKRPHLISDDDLEFLPVNAEVREIVETTRAHDKSLELELSNTSSSPAKRTRCHSQTLETNITIKCDAIKPPKALETNESSQICTATPKTKQRKKLRKTTQDIKETQKPHNDTDSSEDDSRDFDSAMRDCEESNEFLGFEENSKSGTFKSIQHDTKRYDSDEKTKQLPNVTSAKRRRQDNDKDKIFKASLKQRWNLCTEDTDITDDTSPADDEEEICEPSSSNTNLKCGTENVTDSNNKLTIDNKKIKPNDSITKDFLKPRNLRGKSKNSKTDADFQEEKFPQNLQNVKETLHEITKSREAITEIQSKEKKEAITEIKEKKSKQKVSSSESDIQEGKISKGRRSEAKSEKSKNKSESKGIKSKDRSKSNEKHYKTTDSGSDCHNGKKIEQSKGKQKEKVMEIDKDHDCQRENKSKSRNITEDVDKKPDIECKKSKRTRRSRSSKNIKDDKGTNLDPPQQPETVKQPANDREGIDSEYSIIAKEKAVSEMTLQNLATTRKRGRKALKIVYSSEDEQPSTSTKKLNVKTPSERKLKILDSDSDTASTTLNKREKNESITSNSKPSKSSGGRKMKCESNFNPRLLLVTKREQLDTDEILTESNLGSGSIQCGLCLKNTQPSKWSLHLTEHYGVGWKVGEEKLCIESRSIILKMILKYMKDTGCEGLTCRMCKKVYRSGLGLLMHIELCGAASIRVLCEFCKQEYSKLSLPKHLRNCQARSAIENALTDENQDASSEKKELLGNTGRLKRTSTIKAENRLKLLGAELEKITDHVKPDKSEVDPKFRIKYVPPMEGDFNTIWLADIQKRGEASCPKSRCKFISNDLQELSAHLKTCKHIKSGYFCNFCRRVFKSEKEAIEHVIKSHKNGRNRKKSDDSDCDLHTADEQSSDDNDLSEGVDENELSDVLVDEEDSTDDIRGSKKQRTKLSCSRSQNPATTRRKEVFDGRAADLDADVLKKWKNFLKLNYSSQPLYAEFTSNYSVMKQSDFNKYLPSQTDSMKFSFGTHSSLFATIGVPQKNIKWSELKRFESLNYEMNTYFFFGAPIKLCSWLPLPDNVQEQYLAVVYRHEMYKFVKFSQPKQHHSIVLILKVVQNNKIPELNMHYGFMVNDGPIHHLAFLPSGGYDEASNRLGLVAVATVTSCIKVFSLPINVVSASTKDDCSSKNNITLIDVKPSFNLNLDVLCKKEQQLDHITLNPQCLQICWSEYCGHQHIFAGFSNGFVGIWEILNDPQQNLNRFVVDDVINYVPINYFYIGEKCVKCFAVHYDTSGPRWLAISCAHRKFIIYDIKNFMHPVVMKEDVNKNILLSLDWCPIWETLLHTFCDTIQNSGRCVVAVSPNNIVFPHKVDIMACGITQVHYTPLANMCVTALINGDIVFLDTKELHHECILNKKFGERRMLYTMDIKQLTGEPLVRLRKGNDTAPNDWTMQDVKYKEKYGLIFEPLIEVREKDCKIYKSDGRCPPINMLPLTRINTLRCNFNLNGSNLLAIGYENGFLRLVNYDKRSIFKQY